MKVALVHDDLVQWGGAERVLEGICEIYPDAPIFTSVFDKSNTQLLKRFGSKKIITSFLQNIPQWEKLYKILLPLYPIAFEQFDLSEFDLVISHTTRFAKGIITKPKTKHVCFCHTPPRFLWHFSNENTPKFLEPLFNLLRIYDQITAYRVDHFIAGSINASLRIKKIYRRDCVVIPPYIDMTRFKNIEIFDGGYYVVIARLNSYKRVDLVIKACDKLSVPLKIIGTGPQYEALKKQAKISGQNLIEFYQNLDDEMVVKILSGAKALIIPGIEDFGLTSLEAQALGKPVIAYKEGGALETVIDKKTGLFFTIPALEDLIRTIQSLDTNNIKPEGCKQNAAYFTKERFIKKFKQTIASL